MEGENRDPPRMMSAEHHGVESLGLARRRERGHRARRDEWTAKTWEHLSQ